MQQHTANPEKDRTNITPNNIKDKRQSFKNSQTIFFFFIRLGLELMFQWISYKNCYNNNKDQQKICRFSRIYRLLYVFRSIFV